MRFQIGVPFAVLVASTVVSALPLPTKGASGSISNTPTHTPSSSGSSSASSGDSEHGGNTGGGKESFTSSQFHTPLPGHAGYGNNKHYYQNGGDPGMSPGDRPPNNLPMDPEILSGNMEVMMDSGESHRPDWPAGVKATKEAKAGGLADMHLTDPSEWEQNKSYYKAKAKAGEPGAAGKKRPAPETPEKKSGAKKAKPEAEAGAAPEGS